MNTSLVYLDNSATTKPFQEVMETFMKVNEQYYANPASIHQAGFEANMLLTRAREQLAKILNTTTSEVIFTSGGTESNNLAIFGLAAMLQYRGKHIITTKIEHPSILEVMKKLQQDGYDVDYLSVNEMGVVSLQELQQTLRPDTIIVSIMHVNNEMGAIQPIQQIAKMVHQNSRAYFHVDAVQSFGKLPIQFAQDSGPDVITISGHKIHALKGTGLLAFRKSIAITSQIIGGGQEFGLRSGTVSVPQAVALAKAARIVIENQKQSMQNYKRWNADLHAFLRSFHEHVYLLSSEQGAPHIVSFSVKHLKGEILINALQQQHVIVSTSSACSSKQVSVSHVIKALLIPAPFEAGVLRLSFGEMTTNLDIKTFQSVFTSVMQQLKGDSIT